MVAHQGGWDELLMTLGPVLALLSYYVIRERRKRGRGEEPRGGPCPYCGARLSEGAGRCPACGFRVRGGARKGPAG